MVKLAPRATSVSGSATGKRLRQQATGDRLRGATKETAGLAMGGPLTAAGKSRMTEGKALADRAGAKESQARAMDAIIRRATGQDVGSKAQMRDGSGQPKPMIAPDSAQQPHVPTDGQGASNVPGSSGMKPLASTTLDAGAAIARNTALGSKVLGVAGTVASVASKVALPVTAAAAAVGAGIDAFAAYRDGKDAGEVAKAAGWGALKSLTVSQVEEGSPVRSGLAWAGDKIKGAFESANQHYEMAHMGHQTSPANPQQPEVPGTGHRFSNTAILASERARGVEEANLSWGGDPNQGPEAGRPKG